MACNFLSIPEDNMSLTISEKVAETVLAYYRQGECFLFAEQELLDWYATLSLPTKQEVGIMPTLSWEKLPLFRRYALEKRGLSMRVYMTSHLTRDELAHWVDDNGGT
jgi:hypothetical protein